MKQGLSLRVSQHLALTPQLQQSIRLLQLSTLELSQEVEQMLDENPFLEVSEEAATREDFGVAQADAPVTADAQDFESADEPFNSAPATSTTTSSTSESSTEAPESPSADADSEPRLEDSWEGDGSVETAPDDSEWGGDAPARKNNNDDEQADAIELARSQDTLQQHLHRQMLSLRLSPEDRAALHFLIESLNDDGYLEDAIEALATGLAGDDLEEFDELQHRFTTALGLLQNMDPPGVGARSLGECLSLQLLDERNTEETRAAMAICKQPMELLAKRDVKRLSAATGCSEALVKAAIAIIGRLDPKPGRRFVNVERNLIIPDVLVQKSGRGFKVTLNSDVMPKLRVHDIYANALKQHKGQQGAALQQRLQEARWFIKNIQQRFDTILRVSTAIVERQKNFFTHGELAMRPLVLREIADELGLHESTISRVTTAKYMNTPYGTFELKYFFGSGLGTDSGSNASSTAVRALIKQLVAAESAAKPLSDNQISDMLSEQGIECARRTVAKYREALRIAPANLRKTL